MTCSPSITQCRRMFKAIRLKEWLHAILFAVQATSSAYWPKAIRIREVSSEGCRRPMRLCLRFCWPWLLAGSCTTLKLSLYNIGIQWLTPNDAMIVFTVTGWFHVQMVVPQIPTMDGEFQLNDEASCLLQPAFRFFSKFCTGRRRYRIV